MAEDIRKNVVISVQTDTSDAQNDLDKLKKKTDEATKPNKSGEESFKRFKTVIKEAETNAEKLAVKLGTSNAKTIEAQKEVARLKAEYKDFKGTVDAFTPENKFQAVTVAARGFIGVIQGAQGAMTLLGVNSENAQQAIAKLQGLMALSGALNAIDDIRDSYDNFVKLLKSSTISQRILAGANTLTANTFKLLGISVETTSVAFKTLRTAIITTGIGALVVGIGFLISKISDWTSETEDVTKANDGLKTSEEELRIEIESTKTAINDRIAALENQKNVELAQAKSRGASKKELRGIEDKIAQQERDDLEKTLFGYAKEGTFTKVWVTGIEQEFERLTAAKKAAKTAGDFTKEDEDRLTAYASLVKETNQQLTKNLSSDLITKANRKAEDNAEALQKQQEFNRELSKGIIDNTKKQQDDILQVLITNAINRNTLRQEEINASNKSDIEKFILLKQNEINFQNEIEKIKIQNTLETAEKLRKIELIEELKRLQKEFGAGEKYRTLKKQTEQKYNLDIIELKKKSIEDTIKIEQDGIKQEIELKENSDTEQLKKQSEKDKIRIQNASLTEESKAVAIKRIENQLQEDITNIQISSEITRQTELENIRFKGELTKANLIQDETIRNQRLEALQSEHISNLITIQTNGDNAITQASQDSATRNLELLGLIHNNELTELQRRKDEEKNILDAQFEYRQFIYNKIGQLIGGLGAFLKEGSDLQKAFAITEVLIGKASSVFDIWKKNKESNVVIATEASREVASIYAKYAPIPGGEVIATAQVAKTLGRAKLMQARNTISAVANTAAIGIQAAQTIAQITSGKGGGTNASGGGSEQQAPQASSVAPTIQAAATGVQQAQDVRVVNQPGQQVVRAYITDRDLRSNEQRTNFLNQISTF